MPRKAARRFGLLLATLAITSCGSNVISSTPAPVRGVAPQWMAKRIATAACPQVAGTPSCLALIESNGSVSRTVAGWTPRELQARYHLPSSTNGAGQIVAVVDAYDNPNVASDLAAYRAKFKLGKATLGKYNQRGEQGSYPKGSTGWGLEIDLDVEMVSAACPKCTVYLVEADGADGRDLQAAEREAVSLGAHVVSNSWICYDSNSCVDPKYFDAPGVIYLAASGDLGYDNNGAPESFASVVSVGGTVLAKSSSTYREMVWDAAGGGCSSNGGSSGIAKPLWQSDPDCTWRTDSDVSAVAWDVAEYDTYGYGGWFVIGGTSIAASFTAGIYGLAANATDRDAARKFWHEGSKKRAKQLNAITVGADGDCGGDYLCQAGTREFGNYSGPAGWGTPLGIKAY
jgi:subtilase family serine protease